MTKAREPGYVPTPFELYLTIARRTLIGYLILAAIAAATAGITAGGAAVWGVLLGIGIAGTAMSLTLLVMIVTEKATGVNDAAALLGGYIIKMIVLFVVFVALKNYDFFDESAILLGFVAAIIVSLAVDTFTIARTRA